MQDNQTYQRLQPIINMIDKSIVCDSVSTNADGSFTLLTSRTKWAMVGFDISILVTTYRITAVVYNESITVTGAILPAVLTFDLFAPIFKHGTIRVVASELNKVADFRNRLPLIYLKEQTVERLHFDKFDAIDSENDVTLYFLGAADNANWNQEDGDTKGILPMRSLANEFIKVLADNQYVAELTNTGDLRNYNIFGNVSDNGVTKNIFNEPLSGVGLRINIPFLKECDCCDITDLGNRCAPAYVVAPNGDVIAVLYSNELYIETVGGVVTILNQFGDTITTVQSGTNYSVTELTTISDTIDDNTTTIIDNLN